MPIKPPLPSSFACPHCAGAIAVSPDLAGLTVTCPHCARGFAMPGGRSRPDPPALATKTCLYCSERIAATAIKCKHCGSMLVPVPGELACFACKRRES